MTFKLFHFIIIQMDADRMDIIRATGSDFIGHTIAKRLASNKKKIIYIEEAY